MKDENSVPAAQKMTDVSLSIFRSKFKKTRIQMIDYRHAPFLRWVVDDGRTCNSLQPLFGAPAGFLQSPHRPLEDFVLGSRWLGDLVQTARGRHFSISFFRDWTEGNRCLGIGSAAGRD